jgi:hypothetical protein
MDFLYNLRYLFISMGKLYTEECFHWLSQIVDNSEVVELGCLMQAVVRGEREERSAVPAA